MVCAIQSRWWNRQNNQANHHRVSCPWGDLSFGWTIYGASCPWGELPMGRAVHGASCLWSELSMGRADHRVNCAWSELSWGELPWGEFWWGEFWWGEFRWGELWWGELSGNRSCRFLPARCNLSCWLVNFTFLLLLSMSTLLLCPYSSCPSSFYVFCLLNFVSLRHCSLLFRPN